MVFQFNIFAILFSFFSLFMIYGRINLEIKLVRKQQLTEKSSPERVNIHYLFSNAQVSMETLKKKLEICTEIQSSEAFHLCLTMQLCRYLYECI